ncbi:MAG: OsmC family protein [Rhizobiaceae bacterium]|nr:OsmC family protein [Rhizobiaceae bacterium]
MNTKTHEYSASIEWTGNTGEGTSGYKSYLRNWELASDGKPVVLGSNDPVLGGDVTKYNPEDLLVASVASCHMLWYLHLCAVAGVVVTSYRDRPLAIGEMEPNGKGCFKSITLRPKIMITRDSDVQKAHALHEDVHQYCFIARSINFPVDFEPEITKA